MAPLSINSTVKLSSGYQIPILGLGVFRNFDCKPAIEAAYKQGYRHIDSARAYRNEDAVGKAIRDLKIPREEMFISTKIHPTSAGYRSTLRTVQASLDAFGFSYIDLYLIHAPTCGKKLRLETYNALLEKKAEGVIRSVGVSNYSEKHFEEIRAAGMELPSVNQIEIQPFCQQKPIVDYCRRNGIVVEAYCPLIRADFSNPTLQAIAKKNNKLPSQILIRWSLQSGFIPLPKSSNPERVISNANVYDWTLSDEDMATLNALDQGAKGAISWNPVEAD